MATHPVPSQSACVNEKRQQDANRRDSEPAGTSARRKRRIERLLRYRGLSCCSPLAPCSSPNLPVRPAGIMRRPLVRLSPVADGSDRETLRAAPLRPAIVANGCTLNSCASSWIGQDRKLDGIVHQQAAHMTAHIHRRQDDRRGHRPAFCDKARSISATNDCASSSERFRNVPVDVLCTAFRRISSAERCRT